MIEVAIADFGGRPDDGSDMTPVVRRALENCRRAEIEKLSFAPGRYDFWPDRAVEKYAWISNNDSGLKRIAFDLEGMESFELDGNGADFVFHGSILPFWIKKGRGITLRRFSINWARTFHKEGKILEVRDDSVDVTFSDQFPCTVENGILKFIEENGEKTHELGGLLEYDSKRKETAFQAPDHWLGPIYHAREMAHGMVRVKVPNPRMTPGNILVFGPARRCCPAITLSDSRGIELDEVKIHHAGGMAVIAQRSADLRLHRVEVTVRAGRRPGRQRHGGRHSFRQLLGNDHAGGLPFCEPGR